MESFSVSVTPFQHGLNWSRLSDVRLVFSSTSKYLLLLLLQGLVGIVEVRVLAVSAVEALEATFAEQHTRPWQCDVNTEMRRDYREAAGLSVSSALICILNLVSCTEH